MSGTLIKTNGIISINPLSKFIRVLNSGNNKTISWNTSLPLRIGIKGNIKSNSSSKVLDDIRNSYGIDLTSGIDIEKDAIDNEKESLIDKIEYLKERCENNPKDYESKISLDKYTKKLAKIMNSNSTYNNYCLRKKKFKYEKLERLVASFLLVTGQVEYDKEEEKFIFLLDNKPSFYEVNDFKSFNSLEKFNQKIFERTYYVKAENANFIKKAKWSLTTFLQQTNNPFEQSDIKFNKMYKDSIYKKIKKILPLVKKKDAKNILKSLYEFRVNLINNKILKDRKEKESNFNAFTNNLYGMKKYSGVSLKISKKKLVDSFIACFPKSKLKKKDVSDFFSGFLSFLNSNYVTREELEKNYIGREEIEKNYITKKEIRNNYVKKEEIEKDYVKKIDIEKEYIKKTDIEKNYISKKELEKNYVRKTEFDEIKERLSKLEKENLALKEENEKMKFTNKRIMEENKLINEQLLNFKKLFEE